MGCRQQLCLLLPMQHRQLVREQSCAWSKGRTQAVMQASLVKCMEASGLRKTSKARPSSHHIWSSALRHRK